MLNNGSLCIFSADTKQGANEPSTELRHAEVSEKFHAGAKNTFVVSISATLREVFISALECIRIILDILVTFGTKLSCLQQQQLLVKTLMVTQM